MIQDNKMFTETGITDSERFIHTPSLFAKKNLFYVQEAGFLKSLRPHKCIREKLDSFLFLIVLEGEGKLEIKNREYSVKQGDIAFIDCMEHYEHISSDENAWRLGWVHFSGNGAKAYYKLFFRDNGNSNVVKTDNTALYERLIADILSTQNEPAFRGERKCGELILRLANMLIDEVHDENADYESEVRDNLKAVREYLNSNYRNNDVTEKLYKEFEKVDNLAESFERMFGISIQDYLENRRFNAAKELLRFTIKTENEIADLSGLGSTEHMEGLFRQHEGLSPEEYRRKWAGWIRS